MIVGSIKEDIKERGIDTSKHDYITLGSDGGNFYLSVHLRNQKTFDELQNDIVKDIGVKINEIENAISIAKRIDLQKPQENFFQNDNIIDFKDKNARFFEQDIYKFSFFNLVFNYFRI